MENLNTKIFNSIGEACIFFEEELFYVNILMEIVGAYKNTFGGCSCNRARRITNANNVYVTILNGLEEKYILAIKEKAKAEKVVFKINENDIVKEF